MPTILLCARSADVDVAAFEAASARAGVSLVQVTDEASPGRPSVVASFSRDPAHVHAVLDALRGTPIDGLVAGDDDAAWLAASLAQALEMPLHAPTAVEVAGSALLSRGRWMAAGLPVPWFVTVPASGDEDLERLAQVRFPCVVQPAHRPSGAASLRCADYDALMEARARLGTWQSSDRTRPGTPGGDTLMVEAEVPGQTLVLVGTLELGALRVFALFEQVALPDGAQPAEAYVTPARLEPARQQVIAGHIARAALALGLHHGPVEATARVDTGGEIVVLAVAPRAPRGWLGAAIPVVSPARERCSFADALVAHALGRPLDHYGHQALASGVLVVRAPRGRSLKSIDGLDQVAGHAWVMGVQRRTDVGEPLDDAPSPPIVLDVLAQGAQPDDVVATLADAASRLHVRVES